MARAIRQISIFLASPGDVQPERALARSVIEQLNRTVAREIGVHLQAVGWETDARPGYGGDPQSIINGQIADMAENDLFVGIMWNRFGQHTPRAGSGTEEEFDRAVESFQKTGQPEIMFYFSQAPSNLGSVELLDQKTKVLAFKGNVRGNALTWDYAGPQDFERLFLEHLSNWLLNHQRPIPAPPAQKQDKGTPLQTATSTDAQRTAPQKPAKAAWVMLGDTFYESRSLTASADSIVAEIVPNDSDEVARLRSLSPDRNPGAGSVPYAYQDDGGLVQVRGVDMDSRNGETVFTVRLAGQAHQNGWPLESGLNSLSADDIARLRAKLILLNELPGTERHQDAGFTMSFVSGINTPVKVEAGILPALWKSMGKQPDLFPVLARLLAVYYLKASATIEDVLELSFGEVKDGRTSVRFRGRRRRAYTNAEPAQIAVDGDCDLREAGAKA